ncbi:MAG: MFS transporter [Burkholderiales bacterium]
MGRPEGEHRGAQREGAGVIAPSTALAPDAALSPRALAAYGALAVPLAMAALPLYVHLPKFYGDHLGVPLAALGGLLLVLRLADALVDPLLGAWSDRARSRRQPIAWAMPVLAIGLAALFVPPVREGAALLAWLGVALALVYAAFSLATISHGAWGAELSSDPVERTRITAVREALALAGVVVASVAPVLLAGADGEAAGMRRFALAFVGVALACTAATLVLAPAAPMPAAPHAPMREGVARALRDPLFRRLLAVFVANGSASAIPATLVLFFVADVLDAERQQGLFLALYFVAGAAGMPLWVRVSARIGKVRAWLAAMALAVVAFVWAALLGAGDVAAFALICALSGLALGADLALPPSLLADVIGRRGRMESTGAYFGLWTLATKLNLALAAGLALPLLAWLGYAPGTRDASELRALAFVYAGVPCVLKAAAALVLVRFDTRWRSAP